jgi:hypothetical protein
MRNLNRWTMILYVGFTLATPPLAIASEDPALSLSWDVTLASRYLFQGVDLSNNNPVIQPEIALTAHRVTLTAWFNGDLDEGHINEIDLLVGYDLESGPLTVTPGYAYYRYPNRGSAPLDPSQEVYLDITYAAVVNVSLSTHYDFDAGDGAYGSFGLGREFESAQGTVGVGATLYYWRAYYAQSGIPSMEFAISYSATVRSLTITPSLSYFATWDNSDFRDAQAVPSRWLVALSIASSD